MTDLLPVYPDLHTYADIEYIEDRCRNKYHLDKNERLLDRIQIDKDKLAEFGLTKDDIFNNHWNMYMTVYAATNKGVEYDKHADTLIKRLPKGFGNGWTCWGKATTDITLNDQKLRITYVSWGGAEECPIEKTFSDKYHGYQRGDRDWFISNLDNGLNIWVPDLIPSQVGMFGFFQSPSSPYRLDPEMYIKVMGISKPVKKLKHHTERKWNFPSGPFDKEYFMDRCNNVIIKEDDNDIYHAVLTKEDDKDQLIVHFKDNDWISKNKENHVDIFGLPFRVSNIFNSDGYLMSPVAEYTILDAPTKITESLDS